MSDNEFTRERLERIMATERSRFQRLAAFALKQGDEIADLTAQRNGMLAGSERLFIDLTAARKVVEAARPMRMGQPDQWAAIDNALREYDRVVRGEA